MKKWMITVGILLILAGMLLLFYNSRKNAQLTIEVPADPGPAPMTEQETLSPLPDSVLYYGEIKEIRKDAEGNLQKLLMESPRDGAYLMNLGPETYYIDSGKRIAFDPGLLKEGDRVYVFHSPIAAKSLPPQSSAFAILAYIPMDASCGMYHEAENLQQEGDLLLLTTDNGTKILGVDGDTQMIHPDGSAAELTELSEGSYFIAWYWDRGEEVLHPSHIMVLN